MIVLQDSDGGVIGIFRTLSSMRYAVELALGHAVVIDESVDDDSAGDIIHPPSGLESGWRNSIAYWRQVEEEVLDVSMLKGR